MRFTLRNAVVAAKLGGNSTGVDDSWLKYNHSSVSTPSTKNSQYTFSDHGAMALRTVFAAIPTTVDVPPGRTRTSFCPLMSGIAPMVSDVGPLVSVIATLVTAHEPADLRASPVHGPSLCPHASCASAARLPLTSVSMTLEMGHVPVV